MQRSNLNIPTEQLFPGEARPVPNYHILEYSRQIDKSYQCTFCPVAFYKMPSVLWVAITQRRDIIRSGYVIHGKKIEDKYEFFTGLMPTEYPDYFFGDHAVKLEGKKVKSFILFQFSPDRTFLRVFFFDHYNVVPLDRVHFIRAFIDHLQTISF